MGLFDLFKSQTKKKWPGVNPQVLADFQVAQNFLRIRKDLIDKNEHQDWKNFRKEIEMIWIDNKHPNFFIRNLIENKNFSYHVNFYTNFNSLIERFFETLVHQRFDSFPKTHVDKN